MFNRPHLSSVHTFHNFGMTPFMYVAGTFISFTFGRQTIWFSFWRYFLFSRFRILPILLTRHLHSCKHIIHDAYRQYYLSNASTRRQDCQGQTTPIDVSLTRSFYLSQNNPLHQSILRYVLIGNLDHTQRLFKSNLASGPTCPFCQETRWNS